MSKKKPLTAEIDRILLVSALRGEVGDIITTWTALGQLIDECKRLKSGDPNKDIWNDELANKRWLADKLRDEIISRLAELGNKKTGRINFYSVALWLKKIEKNADVYNAFMKK